MNLPGEVLDAIDVSRQRALAEARHDLGVTKGSPQHRAIIAEALPGTHPAEVARLASDPDFHWCGVAVLAWLRRAGITDWRWEAGARIDDKIVWGFAARLPTTRIPEPGDVFVQNAKPYHHGMVELFEVVNGIPWLTSIEGNAPDVRRRTRPAPAHVTYYTIQPLILQSLSL